jgi:hypothetical protein
VEGVCEALRRPKTRRDEDGVVCEYHQELAGRHRTVERHQENRCYHEPQLRGG